MIHLRWRRRMNFFKMRTRVAGLMTLLFFYFDTTQPFENGTNLYGEFSPRLNLVKLFGKDPKSGIWRDVLLAGSLEMGNGKWEIILGLIYMD